MYLLLYQRKEKKSRPPNSYNLFIKDKMREIKEANPEFKGKELMRRATQEWNKQKALVQANTDTSSTTTTSTE